MYKLLVLYPYPDDPQAFLDYYRQHHLPLVKQLPGSAGDPDFGQPPSIWRQTRAVFSCF